jgi:hypothetical protein
MIRTKRKPVATDTVPTATEATTKSRGAKAASATRRTKPQIEAAEAPPPPEPAPAKRETKRDLLIGLLRQPEGATAAQISDHLGWLPHTVRAAITGLRKADHAIERTATEAGSVYRLAAKA